MGGAADAGAAAAAAAAASPAAASPYPVRRNGLARLQRALSVNHLDRSILRIALPALGALALDPLVALADTAFIGHLGAASLGGVGVSNNVFNLSFTCFNFLGLATTPAIARAYGAGDEVAASKLVAQALWVAAVVGVVAAVFLTVYATPIVRFFGASDVVAPLAVAYLRARLISAPAYLSSMVANGAFRGFQDTKTPLAVGLLANMMNLTLYPLLIYGVGMGVAGAGLATAVGQITAGSALFVLLLRKKRLRPVDLVQRPRLREVMPLLRTGAVLSVRTLSIFTTISFATATAAKLGTVEVAAFEIGRQIFALFARLLDAISVAAQSLVALALGQRNFKRARLTAMRLLQVGVLMGCGFVALLSLGAAGAPTLFSRDPAVIAAVRRTFPVMALVQPVNGLVFVLDGIFTAGRKFGFLAGAIFLACVASSSALLWVRTAGLSLQAVWLGLNLMMVLRAGFLMAGLFSRFTPVPQRDPDAEPLEPVPAT